MSVLWPVFYFLTLLASLIWLLHEEITQEHVNCRYEWKLHQDSLDQCRSKSWQWSEISLNANHYRSMPINSNQFLSMPVNAGSIMLDLALIGIDQHESTLGSMPEYWLALVIDRKSPGYMHWNYNIVLNWPCVFFQVCVLF